jgi:hypothetical protein
MRRYARSFLKTSSAALGAPGLRGLLARVGKIEGVPLPPCGPPPQGGRGRQLFDFADAGHYGLRGNGLRSVRASTPSPTPLQCGQPLARSDHPTSVLRPTISS